MAWLYLEFSVYSGRFSLPQFVWPNLKLALKDPVNSMKSSTDHISETKTLALKRFPEFWHEKKTMPSPGFLSLGTKKKIEGYLSKKDGLR